MVKVGRGALADGLRAALEGSRAGSRAMLIGSLAAGTGDLYSDIDIEWVVPDAQFAAAVAEAPSVVARVQPVAAVRSDPDLHHSDRRRLLFVRFEDVPLFWRLDLAIRAASAAPDHDSGNPAARAGEGEWSRPASALANAVGTVKAIVRGRPDDVRGLLDRGFERIGEEDRATGDWAEDIARLARAAARREPAQAALADQVVALSAERVSAAPGGTRVRLFDAIGRGDPAAVQDVLDEGTDIEAADPRMWPLDGETALMYAAGGGHDGIVRLLLSYGADVNAQPATGWTALMRACNAAKFECARLLLDAGADPDLLNIEGYSAYGRTPVSERELIRLLREHGAS